MANLASPLKNLQPNAQDFVVSVAPMAAALNSAPENLSPKQCVPYWQHPKWWQLVNEYLFDNTLELIRVSNEQQGLIALMPVQRVGGLLKSPQHPHLTIGDSLWLHTETQANLDNAMDAILDTLDAWGWECGNAPDGSALSVCRDASMWQWRKVRESAWFDTQSSAVIPGKLRRNLNRHERLINAKGPLTYTITNAQQKDEISNAMTAFIELEGCGWKRETGTAIQLDSTLTKFYTELEQLNSVNALLEIHQLIHDNVCIAAQLAIRCNDTRYLLKIAYSEAHSARSPGSLLLLKTLEHSVTDNVSRLSLVSAPEWSMRWKPNLFPVWHVTRFSNDARGKTRQKAHMLRHGLLNQLRETRKQLAS